MGGGFHANGGPLQVHASFPDCWDYDQDYRFNCDWNNLEENQPKSWNVHAWNTDGQDFANVKAFVVCVSHN